MNRSKIYGPEEIEQMIKDVRLNFRFSWSNKKQKYFNVPACLDIETSSFYDRGKKVGIMYEWTLGIYGAVMVGRTYDELVNVLSAIARILDLNLQKRFIIYVHNLGFDFEFIRRWFTLEKVFAIRSRKPLYALMDNGIEFRCSYLLSGYSLAKLGDQLQVYDVHKAVGDLDYSRIRHQRTPLTDTEIGYCVADVKVVMAYIAELIEKHGGLAKLPLTKTGFVRKYCRDSCFYEPDKPRKGSYKRLRYMEQIKALTIEPEEYLQMKRAFQGGFTHANCWSNGRVIADVTSYDFTSSYPTVMVAEQFPMSAGELVEIKGLDDLRKNLRLYCCIFDVEFTGLVSRFAHEDYISSSRCYTLKGAIIDNGRVTAADLLRTTITEQDFHIIRKMYHWEKMRVSNFRRYQKGYLPTDFVKAILKLYADKTTLRGVPGMEAEYQSAKEMLNSCYGMAVTDIVREIYGYEDENWLDPEEPDLVESIAKYNKSPGRFLFYAWGVYVTAYARRNLYSGIFEFGADYIYSDTDSVKVTNAGDHVDYIRGYNQRIIADLERALDYHGLPHDLIRPKTVNGVEKPLGVWDFDGHYSKFKTLGAKRYMVEYSDDPRNGSDAGKLSLTVAGVNKRTALPYMQDKYGAGIWEAFSDDLYIPPEYSGKQTHTYIDDPRDGVVIDYLGEPAEYHEKSCIHMEAADYSLSISREYRDFLIGLEDIE